MKCLMNGLMCPHLRVFGWGCEFCSPHCSSCGMQDQELWRGHCEACRRLKHLLTLRSAALRENARAHSVRAQQLHDETQKRLDESAVRKSR